MIKRVKIQIQGAVQGVGFRPFVYRLATGLGLKGWVINSSEGVFIESEGFEEQLNIFLDKLKIDKPKNSVIQSFEYKFLEPCNFENFEIRISNNNGAQTALVLPDIATCDDCAKEIFDPTNRRYLYPFTNCTNCGPRFTIIKALPYDRANTTMAEFIMCDDCMAEYTDPLNRRFHAEPIACPKCGPQVTLWNALGETIAEKNDAVLKCAELIKQGYIIALKGIGGFQLLADAGNSEAIKKLRIRKHRSEKPFALMFPDLDSIKEICEVSSKEEILLKSVEAPIVLLKRKKSGNKIRISNETAVNNPYLGVMLPYSPLHHILMSYLKTPVVATSGNISEEPICTSENIALDKLKGIADYFLVHNRKILRHVDDSIVRIAAGNDFIIRRARGYAPFPVEMEGQNKPVLAVGAHLKNTIAISKGKNVFISQHIGDLENTEAINAFENVIEDFKSFYRVQPQKVIADMHPDYISTKYADKNFAETVHHVQHHYAHVLSCMAENNIEGEVLGISWDGTGYGKDGTIWGSEFLVSQGAEFKRVGHIKPFKIPGGEKAIEHVWRLGLSLLYELYGETVLKMKDLSIINEHCETDLKLILQMIDKNINSPLTTSMGRLFDGVAAIMGIKRSANYEAQAAMELEFAADDYQTNDYFDYDVQCLDGINIIDWKKTIEKVLEGLKNGVDKKIISAKFHNTLAECVVNIAELVNIERVVLTGGCFLNKYLLERTIKRLEEEKFKVYWHKKVPSGDGGISLGQIKYSTYLKN